MPNIRLVQTKDLAAIEKLDAEVYGEDYYRLTTVRQWFDLFGQWMFVSETDELNGYSLGGLVHGTDIAWILSVMVSDRYQRQGIGTSLTNAVVSSLKETNASFIKLTVDPENKPATNLYKLLGFKNETHDPNYYGEGKGRLVMCLNV